MKISVRQAISQTEGKSFDTAALRENFLIETLFSPGKISMTYSHLDRTVIGGVMPVSAAIPLVSSKEIGSDVFLARREMGVFLISGSGQVLVDGTAHPLRATDCLYLPMGCEKVEFSSDDPNNPAKFYFISLPAHKRHAVQKITANDAIKIDLGTGADANERVLRQYIHPDICTSCQLVMGMTSIATGSVWNTMPCHTHDRRSEVYLYLDMADDTRVFHFMGAPTETRHLVVANEQAILSPGWSIHCGAGTGRYAFIWSMGGDNQDFTDMDFVAMKDLK